MSGLLIYTTGDTDVQLVENGQRWELRKVSKELARPERKLTLSSSSLPKARCEPRTNLPDGDLEICTPKADAVLAYLAHHAPDLRQVLLLHTDRPNDPVHATRLVKERLERAGLTVDPVSFLSEGPLEGTIGCPPDDAVIRRVVSQRLEQVVSIALENSSGPLVVAAIGGMPSVRALVTELVRLHASARTIHELDVTDRSGTSPSGSRDLTSSPALAEATHHAAEATHRAAEATHQDRAIERHRLDPTELVAARRHALTLVERGNFVAAWGAVAHLEHEPSCQPWVQALRWLYQWATSQPIDEACDVPIINETTGAAAVALRVEQALVNGELHRAISNTSAFFEELVWAHLRSGYVTDSGQRHQSGDSLYRVSPEPPRSNGFTRREQLFQVRNFGLGHRDILDYLVTNSESARQQTPGIFATQALSQLKDLAEDVQDARNNTAHSEPDRDQLRAATATFRDLGLWTADNHFLSAPLISAALREIGTPDPESLFDRLVAAIRARLLALDPPPAA